MRNNEHDRIRYGVGTSRNRNDKQLKQLTIDGPTEFIVDHYEEYKVGSRRPFMISKPKANGTSTWMLNANAIGRMIEEESKNESLERANDYISRIVKAVASEKKSKNPKIVGDPLLDVLAYERNDKGHKFDAVVTKPVFESEQAGRLVLGYAHSIAADLGINAPKDSISASVWEGGNPGRPGGMSMLFDNKSNNGDNLSPTGIRTADPHENHFEIQAYNLQDEAQLLVMLFAATTIAHVEELPDEVTSVRM